MQLERRNIQAMNDMLDHIQNFDKFIKRGSYDLLRVLVSSETVSQELASGRTATKRKVEYEIVNKGNNQFCGDFYIYPPFSFKNIEFIYTQDDIDSLELVFNEKANRNLRAFISLPLDIRGHMDCHSLGYAVHQTNMFYNHRPIQDLDNVDIGSRLSFFEHKNRNVDQCVHGGVYAGTGLILSACRSGIEIEGNMMTGLCMQTLDEVKQEWGAPYISVHNDTSIE